MHSPVQSAPTNFTPYDAKHMTEIASLFWSISAADIAATATFFSTTLILRGIKRPPEKIVNKVVDIEDNKPSVDLLACHKPIIR